MGALSVHWASRGSEHSPVSPLSVSVVPVFYSNSKRAQWLLQGELACSLSNPSEPGYSCSLGNLGISWKLKKFQGSPETNCPVW